MSMGDADAKFPGQHTGIPPSPTRENPAQVYPKSDPNPAPRMPRSGDDSRVQTAIGNPFLLQSALKHVDDGLARVVVMLQEEERSQGGSQKEEALIAKFKGWRDELSEIMLGGPGQATPPSKVAPPAEGGMFTD
ncbi:hypothetical protein D9756_007999 [Leucocoprinus leucothites]|uniref:Uncharacterized protein n=1 Tax=Leucocoprinus leucothites TaxID=201217 RepID=A0A8H5D4M8_9AGAR|nr:hypothetical protein D9756_007999 [Leucoagaricus leucothites]